MATVCRACGYQRRATDLAPDWQCPSCGKAYAKSSRDAASPLVIYTDDSPRGPDRGVGMKFFKVVAWMSFGPIILMAFVSLVLVRFWAPDPGSAVTTAIRFLCTFPMAVGSPLLLLGQLRNAMNGFVIGWEGMSFKEMYAAERPLSFLVTLIGSLVYWGVMTYLSFKLVTHARDWSNLDL